MKRLLIVDDEPDVREMLKLLLSPRFQVDTASNGRDALEKVKLARYDAIVLDLMMPLLDGEGFLREAREQDLDVPVLLMSAAQNLLARAHELGVAAVCAKPCDADKLEHELTRIMSK